MTPDAPPPDAQATAPVSLLADRYQLLDKLGQGGMGAVFHARDAQLDRHVAVKLLPADSIHDADAVARFHREAKALARLSHPGIIQAFDHGADGDRHFLVMEFVEGRSLAGVLREQGRVVPARAADFAYQAALALHHAHKSGLVHRDVKPSNLLLSADGRLRLLDLGLARFLQDQIGDAGLTREGAGLGTPDYCPPEQFRDARSADPRADVYSLGCTLYHLIAGRVPFPGSSFSEKARAHETQEPAPLEELCPDVPAGLALTVRRMMAKRPADRFQNMAEVAEALMPHVAGSSASFPHIRQSATWDGSRLATMPVWSRRRRGVTFAAVGALAALLVVGAALAVERGAGWFRPDEPAVALSDDSARGDAGGREADGDGSHLPAGGDTGRDRPKEAAGKAEGAAPAADDPNVLTVSLKAEDGGKYRSIGEALAAVGPGQTVRIIDRGVYRERIFLNRPETQRGLTVEATNGAVIEANTPDNVVHLVGVSGVTLRGLHVRPGEAAKGQFKALVLVTRPGPGIVLDRLDLDGGAAPVNGVEVWGPLADDTPGEPLVVLRDSTIRRALHGVLLMGLVGAKYNDPMPVGRVQVRDNLISDCGWGFLLRGAGRRVRVVGNRITGCKRFAIQLEQLLPGTEDVLIANNTLFENNVGVRLWDSVARGKDVRIRNNLLLACAAQETLFVDSGGDPQNDKGPGDGRTVARVWEFSHNWTDFVRPSSSDPYDPGRIPLAPKAGNVRKEKIDDFNRDRKSPDFLRPGAKSLLAAAGAGQEDPSLPCYVGALPPEGTNAWDWDRAGRVPKDAQLLTVSKDSKDGGAFRSIREALKKVEKPWATVRVLDGAEYEEEIVVEDANKYLGLTVEAVNGAVLRPPGDSQRFVVIEDVPYVRLIGFKVTDQGRSRPGSRTLVSISGRAGGVVLAGLEISPTKPLVGLAIKDVTTDPKEPPVRVERCTIRPQCPMSEDGIYATGSDAKAPAGGLCLRGNHISRCLRGVNLRGALHDVQVAGNVIAACAQAGIQVEDLAGGSSGILIANNTAFENGSAFRVWDNAPFEQYTQGQAEVVNNLFFKGAQCDMAFVYDPGGGKAQSPGDGKMLLARWRFRQNRRDFSGTHGYLAIPIADEDQRLSRADLPSVSAEALDRVRPVSGSALATGGAGSRYAALPTYVGALPPEGAPVWDWDRTWRARVKKAEDKK